MGGSSYFEDLFSNIVGTNPVPANTSQDAMEDKARAEMAKLRASAPPLPKNAIDASKEPEKPKISDENLDKMVIADMTEEVTGVHQESFSFDDDEVYDEDYEDDEEEDEIEGYTVYDDVDPKDFENYTNEVSPISATTSPTAPPPPQSNSQQSMYSSFSEEDVVVENSRDFSKISDFEEQAVIDEKIAATQEVEILPDEESDDDMLDAPPEKSKPSDKKGGKEKKVSSDEGKRLRPYIPESDVIQLGNDLLYRIEAFGSHKLAEYVRKRQGTNNILFWWIASYVPDEIANNMHLLTGIKYDTDGYLDDIRDAVQRSLKAESKGVDANVVALVGKAEKALADLRSALS